MTAGPPFHPLQEALQRPEQSGARARYAAAHDDGFRIENVDERTDGCGQRFHRFQPDGAGLRVAFQMRRDQVGRRVKPAARTILNRAIADGHFETAGCSGTIGGSVWIERGVPQMACAPDVTAQQPAIDHRRTAHTRAQREHNGVFKTARRAHPRFTQQRRVRVVQDGNHFWCAEKFCPIKPFQSLQALRHARDGASVRRREPRC